MLSQKMLFSDDERTYQRGKHNDSICIVETDRLIGKNLLRLRKLRGMSQQDLAEKVGIMREKISVYENGAGISTGTFERICQALGVESWEFHVTENTPIAESEEEVKRLMLGREADRLNVSGEIVDFAEYVIKKAKAGETGSISQAPANNVIQLRRKTDKYTPEYISSLPDAERIKLLTEIFGPSGKDKEEQAGGGVSFHL